jgi:hypothetical protein
MKTKIFDMAYEIDNDMADIEQDVGCGEVNAVYLHKTQIGVLAGEMGLLKGDADAWRRVAALERRLGLIRDRIEMLDGMLWKVAEDRYEVNDACVFSEATLDVVNEYCAEIAKTPENGSVDGSNHPKNGTLSKRNAPENGTIAGAQGELLEAGA